MNKNSIKTNFTYQLLYRILTVITPLITSPYLSRVLGVEQLGKYSASQAFVNYFALCAMLGIEKYGNRCIARLQDDKKAVSQVFWSIYIIQFTASLFSMIVYVVSINILAFTSVSRTLYIFQGLWVLSSLLDINWLFFGLEQFKITVTRSIVIKIVSVILIILCVKKPEDLNLYALIMSGSMVVSQLALWMNLNRYVIICRINFSQTKKHLLPVFKLFIPVIANTVFHIMDKTMLGILSDDANSGYYYNADKLINIPLGVITAISTVMLPRVTNTLAVAGKKDANELLVKSCEITAFLTYPISLGIGAIATVFVPFFFGNGYDECIILIIWFVPVLIIKAFSDFVRSQFLIPTGNDNLYTGAMCAGAISNLFFNYILIRNRGALGAVQATLLSEAIVLVIQCVFTYRELPYVSFVLHNLPYLFSSILMSFIVVFVSRLTIGGTVLKLFLMILIGALVYFVGSIVYWMCNKKSIFYCYLIRIVKH